MPVSIRAQTMLPLEHQSQLRALVTTTQCLRDTRMPAGYHLALCNTATSTVQCVRAHYNLKTLVSWQHCRVELSGLQKHGATNVRSSTPDVPHSLHHLLARAVCLHHLFCMLHHLAPIVCYVCCYTCNEAMAVEGDCPHQRFENIICPFKQRYAPSLLMTVYARMLQQDGIEFACTKGCPRQA